jgi:hydrogenase maturation protein HypF
MTATIGVPEQQKESSPELQRLRVVIRGAVQGVGFRPFVFRLASELALPGWVINSAAGVVVEVEGSRATLEAFLLRIEREKPSIAFIQSLESSWLDAEGFTSFEIRESSGGEKTVLVLPDVATCPDCRNDISSVTNRRYRYPFTNCTNCGPRYTIIEGLPYDRPNTSMKKFAMCEACRREYENPADRRFHAQPNACPDCGPHLELWDGRGSVLWEGDDALVAAAKSVRDGSILAVKGLGGFHLMCRADDSRAVEALRERKRREEKPFAVMFPSMQSLRASCEVDPLEERLLNSPEAPIVLLRKRQGVAAVAEAAAPGNPNLGAMLPYTPLHHLLLDEVGLPVVATSGNISDEPICTDEEEALTRLRSIADFFLVHNRPIVRHVDDSIVRVVLGRELVLRRARGYAPLPVLSSAKLPKILAVGAHQKSTVAASIEDQVFISQHIGDLETRQAFDAFREVIGSFSKLYDYEPERLASDLHPDYLSTQYALRRSATTVGVQHHYAHVLSCMAENGLNAPVLGVAWDGSGYGPDGTIWGGEFLLVGKSGFERLAHLKTFPLPGGDRAIKEPRRAAAGILYQIFGPSFLGFFLGTPAGAEKLPIERAFPPEEALLLSSMLERHVRCPETSSAGRLFDAVAALTGVRQKVSYEGQAAMQLEFAAESTPDPGVYPFEIVETSPLVVNWEPAIRRILTECADPGTSAVVPARFHNTLAEIIVAVAKRIGESRIALTGGCFQNRYLTERTVQRLREEGFRPYWHQRVPPNDGGIALGQIFAAAREMEKENA